MSDRENTRDMLKATGSHLAELGHYEASGMLMHAAHLTDTREFMKAITLIAEAREAMGAAVYEFAPRLSRLRTNLHRLQSAKDRRVGAGRMTTEDALAGALANLDLIDPTRN